jgi:import inner membrane translocase subunit TIM23
MLVPARATVLRALAPCATPLSLRQIPIIASSPLCRVGLSLSQQRTTTPAALLSARFRSTIAPNTPQPPPSSSSATPPKQSSEPPLEWNRFFRLRNIRRRYQVVFSIVGAVAGTAAGFVLIVTGVSESLVSVVPLDPMVSMGLIALSCGGLGWLGGPALGTVLFNVLHRGGFSRQMLAREAEFYARIKKHRVDPSSSSAQNPGMWGKDNGGVFMGTKTNLWHGSSRLLRRAHLERAGVQAVAPRPAGV